MASKLPAKLKSIAPLITRGHQVEAHNPVIAYWCYYCAVQQILSNNLHSGDSEASRFTSNLLDELEQRKEGLSSNEAVTDDVVAQAYIEDFVQRVFERADVPLQAGRATRQTAETFLAAATFFDLCKIFGENTQEINQKIKYSKFHAARILKAIQAGESPNIKSPAPEKIDASPPQVLLPQQATDTPIYAVGYPPEEDQQLPKKVAQASPEIQPLDYVQVEEHHPPRFPIVHPQPRPPSTSFGEFPAANSQQRPEKEFFSAHSAPHPQIDSRPMTGNSDPLIPHDLPQTYPQATPPPRAPYSGVSPALSATPSNETFPSADLTLGHPPFNPLGGLSGHPPQHQNQSFISAPAVYTPLPPPPMLPMSTADFYKRPPPAKGSQYHPSTPPSAMSHFAPLPDRLQATRPKTPELTPPQVLDSETTAKAQKHARWAISALDYEDYPTAVENLRKALQLLGAS